MFYGPMAFHSWTACKFNLVVQAGRNMYRLSKLKLIVVVLAAVWANSHWGQQKTAEQQLLLGVVWGNSASPRQPLTNLILISTWCLDPFTEVWVLPPTNVLSSQKTRSHRLCLIPQFSVCQSFLLFSAYFKILKMLLRRLKKKAHGAFYLRFPQEQEIEEIWLPTTEILRLLKHLWNHNHAVTPHRRNMSSPSRRKIWTLISPHSCNNKKTQNKTGSGTGRLEDCVSLRMLFPRCPSSWYAVNCSSKQKGTTVKMPKTLESDLTLLWPVFAGTAGVQGPRASDHLHQANPNMHMDSLLCTRPCKHSMISSSASCVSVSSTKVPASALGWSPPESAIHHLALLGGSGPSGLGDFFTAD